MSDFLMTCVGLLAVNEWTYNLSSELTAHPRVTADCTTLGLRLYLDEYAITTNE
jgi:hypothetical protein